MTDRKISELTNITGANLAENDEFVLVDTSADETKAITFGELKTAFDTGTGFVRVTGDTMTGALDVQSTITADGLTVDGDISATGGDVDLDTLDLKAIAATKGVTAVDVFVYDTSKDSDGGAWRKRTQGTSWYNEALNTATRGSRREFPAVAVIVVHQLTSTGKVTIYDGDDPALPMWMVINGNTSSTDMLPSFNNTSLSCVSALNGTLMVGNSTYDIAAISFIEDTAYRWNTIFKYRYNGNIAQRSDSLDKSTFSSGGIVNRAVNDVAMTVLPDAPIDPATGLPVPTIAVATDGGVSVIKDDGTVVDLTYTASVSNEAGGVWFPESGGIGWQSRSASGGYVYTLVENEIPASDKSTASDALYANFGQKNFVGNDLVTLGTSQARAFIDGAIGSPNGLTRIDEKPTAPSEGMAAYTTSTYNTGWMNGDIKGAFLADTDDTDLTDAELVTNGTFDTDISGWTDASVGSSSISWNASGYLQLDGVGGDRAIADSSITTVIGETYSLKIINVGDPFILAVGSSVGGAQLVNANTPTLISFVAASTTTYIRILSAAVDGTQVLIDNISVQLADADRSVNNNGLIVNGTVTRSPVATGAELVAYSGFSASNYLEQPYNPDLDFGTGDFCVMGWVNVAVTGSGQKILFHRCDLSLAGGLIEIRKLTGDTLRVYTGATGYSSSDFMETTSALPASWAFVSVVRRSGVLAVSINGGSEQTIASASNVSNSSAALSIGVRYSDAVLPFDNAGGGLALWRISATAPSAEQIAKIYNDEKVLFQENAACTLYGTSDAVTALAHDSDTDLLHVGTSAGRSVFQGLRRVSNTTTAVGTAISASNGLVVEE